MYVFAIDVVPQQWKEIRGQYKDASIHRDSHYEEKTHEIITEKMAFILKWDPGIHFNLKSTLPSIEILMKKQPWNNLWPHLLTWFNFNASKGK